ncbi:MAG: anti-sigma factor family protein [Marmoricola sp.]
MRGFSFTGLTGHVGDSVSALVDGQLSEAEEERVWAHVLGCPGCRRLVEHEGWTKNRLRALSGQAPQDAPAELLGHLYAVEDWATVDRIERSSRRRRAAVAVVGAGSLGVAVLGIVAATSAPAGRGEVPGAPAPATLRSELISGVVGSTAGWAVGSGATAQPGPTDGVANGVGTGVVGGPATRRTAR